jgi:type III pantothenate kinase
LSIGDGDDVAPVRVLAIDAGNTRIKWGLHDGREWSSQASVGVAQGPDLHAAFASLSADRIIISNVAGETVAASLAASLPAAPTARWIKSERVQCGVRNSYDDPRQLGCDRWAALIGAWRLYRGPAIVVNAGTALTVDALTGDGVFAGGTIAPGAQLMRDALATRTAALKLQSGSFSYFPDRTGDAITSGIINALCGAVERMAHFLEETGQTAPLCVLSGGAAALLAPHLHLELRTLENLVLEGLLTIAQSERG